MRIAESIRQLVVRQLDETRWMKFFRASAWLLLLAPVGCGDGRTPLVLYSPHGRDLLELMERTYEAERPEIDVRWLDMGSQEVYDRIRSESVNPQADVWFGGPDRSSRGESRMACSRRLRLSGPIRCRRRAAIPTSSTTVSSKPCQSWSTTRKL